MENLIYFLLGILFGGLICTYLSRSYTIGVYNQQLQQQKIASFIQNMKRLVKEGEIPIVELSLQRFAKKCMDYDTESFKSFRRKEFRAIANYISGYNYQYAHDYSKEENGFVNINLFETHISIETTQQNIIKILKEIIGI